MPSLAVDAARTAMIATGKVVPVIEWRDGKRTQDQKRDPNTGMPLWVVDVLIDDDADRSTVAGVEVGSLGQPTVQKLHPIMFVGLTCSFYVNRNSGQLSMRWAADDIAGQHQKAAAA